MAAAILTKNALARKKANGEVYTAVAPFGYQAIDGRLIPSSSQAAIVAEIHSKRSAGATLAGIAQALNDRGVKGNQGGKWYPSTVSNILNREAA